VVTRGEPARVARARAFADALAAAGVRATAVEVPGVTHEQVNAAIGAPGDTAVTPGLMAFLRGCDR
jgi:acetyl esterase/lipase